MSDGFERDAIRHALVRIAPDAWTAELAAHLDLADDPLVRGWAARSWPLVVRRRIPSDGPDRVPLGLPLPPSHGKKRIALAFSPAAVLSLRPALRLNEVRDSAPEVWYRTIDAVLDLAHNLDIEARVFGSFALAALTGLDYVTAASDLDLIWPLTAHIDELLARLAALEATAPGRLDGEIVASGDAAVNWRELASGAADVLVKTGERIALMPTAAFLQTAREPA